MCRWLRPRLHRPRRSGSRKYARFVEVAWLLGFRVNLTPDQVRSFVGSRAEYYLARWSRIQLQQGRALGLNWPAFFFTVFWLLYRRMYRVFWMVMGLVVISGLAQAALEELIGSDVSRLSDAVLGIAVSATFGTFGTYWYYLHAERRIRLLEARGQPSTDDLKRAGGTSWGSPSLGVAMGLLLLIGTASTNGATFEDRKLDQAKVLINAGRYSDAELLYKDFQRSKPDDPEAHWGLILIYIQRDDTLALIQELRAVLRSDPTNSDAIHLLNQYRHKGPEV